LQLKKNAFLFQLWYDPNDLLMAWDNFIAAADQLQATVLFK
jgi:hypothetical protein